MVHELRDELTPERRGPILLLVGTTFKSHSWPNESGFSSNLSLSLFLEVIFFFQTPRTFLSGNLEAEFRFSGRISPRHLHQFFVRWLIDYDPLLVINCSNS